MCQLGYAALCITHSGIHTAAHSHCMSAVIQALLSISLYLTLYKTQAFDWHTGLKVISLISHLALIPSQTPGLIVCQCMCDFKVGLVHCQLLWNNHVGDDWTIADRCVTHTHGINRDSAKEVKIML